MVLVFLACTSSRVIASGTPEPEPTLTGDTATEGLPGDTADSADSGDTAVDPPKVEPTVPAQVTLDCPGAIPADTSITCTFTASSPDWPDGSVSTPAELSLRGRSSSSFPKPQYKVTFVDGAGASAPAELFGMGRESDWVLNGMWIDRAMIRNKLAWDLFNELAKGVDHAPESVYTELTLDGDYRGVYLLNQMVDHDASRLDFADDDGTGSRFIVSADEDGFTSNVQYGHWKIDYPPTSQQTREVKAGVQDGIAEWEARITGAGDPFDLMDLDSFVLFILTEEFMKNNDGYFLSHRVWRGDDTLLRMVPWDLDLTLGQPSYNDNENPKSWIQYRTEMVTGSQTTAFQSALEARWVDARKDVLATDAVIARIEHQRAVMGDATARNWARWDITTVDFSGYLYPVTSSEQEFDLVEAWVKKRLDWMDDNVASF